MGDVKDILLGSDAKQKLNDQNGSQQAELSAITGDKKPLKRSTKKKPMGMSREVFALVGSEDGYLPGMQPSRPSAFKEKREAAGQTRWAWVPFFNSGRTDGVAFHHWQKVGVETPDYPYAKYNVRLDALEVSEEEYAQHLRDPAWDPEGTRRLLRLCHRYDLRWPVVADRFNAPGIPPRPVEDLMARYWAVVQAVVVAHPGPERAGRAHHPFAVGGDPAQFDRAHEAARRRQLDLHFRKPRSEEQEEMALREELRALDAQLRQLRKATKDNDSSKGDDYGAWAEARAKLDAERPRPAPGEPYLQSQRLPARPFQAPPAKQAKAGQGPQLSKTLLKKAAALWAELGCPENPVATRRVADLADLAKRDAVVLLTLRRLERAKRREAAHLRALVGGGGASSAEEEKGDAPPASAPELALPSARGGRKAGGGGGAAPAPGKQRAGQKRAGEKNAGNSSKRKKKN
mmetsp:Transcript_9795/g.17278  ORF Transcript_9795/g.17278 Transcript_9795/m.17278 type:complete len:460 (+) Transcript_9795:37-1416(+)